MNKNITLRAMALAGVCLAPLAAAAQSLDVGGAATPDYNNEIELGARWQSQSSPIFGRYSGTADKGFTAVAGFDVQGRTQGDTFYYEAFGHELDVNSKKLAPDGSLGFKVGDQGIWSVGANYDSIEHTGQTFYSPWTASGTLAQGLKANSGTGAFVPTSMAQDTSGTRREILAVDGKYSIGEWSVSTKLQNDHKEGTLLESMHTTTYGVSIPLPVNSDTLRYTAKGTYTADRLQAVLSYDFSKYTDNANAVYPYWYYNSSAPTGITAIFGTPPSNDAHLVNGSVGYDLAANTRLDAAFHVGIEQQDDTVDSGTGVKAWQTGANPVTSNLFARLYGGNVSFTSSPVDRFDIHGSYNLDAKQEDSFPTLVYGASGGDGTATSKWYSTPLGYTNQSASIDAGYRILPGTKFTLGYAYKDVHREFWYNVGSQGLANARTDWYTHSGENDLSAKLAFRPMPGVNGSIGYEHSIRAANVAYYGSTTANGGALWYEAPMVADTVKLRTSYSPSDDLSAGVNGKFSSHHYNNPVNTYGLDRDITASIGPDVTYRPVKTLSTHLFYTYEKIYYGLNTVAGTTGTPNNNGFGTHQSSDNIVHTLGVSEEWKPVDKLKLSVDYVLEYGNISYNAFDGIVYSNSTSAASNIQQLPDVNSSMHTVKVKGEYELAPNLSLLAAYQFDVLATNDWAYSYGTGTSATTSVMTSGETSPSYRVHTVYTAVKVKF